MTLAGLKILGRRTLIKVLPWDEKKGGIYLPCKARRNEDYAMIIKVADNSDHDYKPGDKVMINRYPEIYTKIDIEEVEYTLLFRTEDILMMIERAA